MESERKWDPSGARISHGASAWQLLTGIVLVLTITCGVATAGEGGAVQGLDALAGLIGDWEVAGTMLDLEGTPVAIQSAATIASGLEGRSIDERSSYLLPPHSVEFVCIRSWDEYRKQYRMACIDSLTGLLDVYEGALEDGRLVMTNLDTGTAAEVNGTRMYGRQTISEILPDSFLVTWEYSLDDGATWNQYGQLRYRRQGVEVGLAQE